MYRKNQENRGMGWRIKQRPARIGGAFRNNQGNFVGFATKPWFEDAKANFGHERTEKKATSTAITNRAIRR
jgi:hypothetical protein